MKPQYLTATDLMNYLYDPRSVYFSHILKIPQEVTLKMEEGKKIHDLYTQRSKRNKIIKELPRLDKQYDIYIESDKIKYATRIDCILFTKKRNKAYPVEFKYSRTPKKLYHRQIYQLVLEAILVEDFYNCKVNIGYMKFMVDDNFVKVHISKELKNSALHVLGKIQSIIEKEEYPNIKGLHPRLKDYGYRNVI